MLGCHPWDSSKEGTFAFSVVDAVPFCLSSIRWHLCSASDLDIEFDLLNFVCFH